VWRQVVEKKFFKLQFASSVSSSNNFEFYPQKKLRGTKKTGLISSGSIHLSYLMNHDRDTQKQQDETVSANYMAQE
jgi:hypothetical protein